MHTIESLTKTSVSGLEWGCGCVSSLPLVLFRFFVFYVCVVSAACQTVSLSSSLGLPPSPLTHTDFLTLFRVRLLSAVCPSASVQCPLAESVSEAALPSFSPQFDRPRYGVGSLSRLKWRMSASVCQCRVGPAVSRACLGLIPTASLPPSTFLRPFPRPTNEVCPMSASAAASRVCRDARGRSRSVGGLAGGGISRLAVNAVGPVSSSLTYTIFLSPSLFPSVRPAGGLRRPRLLGPRYSLLSSSLSLSLSLCLSRLVSGSTLRLSVRECEFPVSPTDSRPKRSRGSHCSALP